MFLRKRSRERTQGPQGSGGYEYPPPPPPPETDQYQQATSPAVYIERKPVPFSTASPSTGQGEGETELSGQGVSRELSGREIHPFPDTSPNAPVAVPGQYEMPVENRPHEMAGSGDPYRRHELPGQRY